MPHIAEAFKEVASKGVGRITESKAPFANPDKLVLPKALQDVIHDVKASLGTDPLDRLTDKQIARIENYKNLCRPRPDRFEGDVGNSMALPDVTLPTGPAAKEWLDNHGLKGIEYRNGYPDFSNIAAESVTVPKMTADRPANFADAYRAAAKKWNHEARDGRTDWKASEVKKWAKDNGLTVHEKEDLKTCEFVPTCVHDHFKHLGGKSIAAIAGIYSDRQIAIGVGNAGGRNFYDQFDA